MASSIHDLFSERAGGYARYRPHYPNELIDYLAEQTLTAAGTPLAVWEAGCGSGQLTTGLAGRFDLVLATDASAEQLARARPHARIEYRQAPAELSGLPDNVAALAVAAQAAHWFDLNGYYREVRRVVRSGGLVALVVYGLHAIDDPSVHHVIQEFYGVTLAPYWSPRRKLVEDEYRTIEFPFEEMHSPRFEMHEQWSLDELLGYVATWSATAALLKAGGGATFEKVQRSTGEAWGDPSLRKTIHWPLTIRLGRIG